MSQLPSKADIILKLFLERIKRKNYQFKQSEKDKFCRLDISNIKETTIVNVYNTGSIVIGGPKNELHEEFESIKREIEANLNEHIKAD